MGGSGMQRWDGCCSGYARGHSCMGCRRSGSCREQWRRKGIMRRGPRNTWLHGGCNGCWYDTKIQIIITIMELLVKIFDKNYLENKKTKKQMHRKYFE